VSDGPRTNYVNYILIIDTKILKIQTFNEKMEKEITTMDQKLVLELDQLVSDQQATFEVREYFMKQGKLPDWHVIKM